MAPDAGMIVSKYCEIANLGQRVIDTYRSLDAGALHLRKMVSDTAIAETKNLTPAWNPVRHSAI
jgi:hypothetical protein